MDTSALRPERATLYGEVADRILNLISAGTLTEGSKVPSIRTLSRQLSVSINTVREAYWLLESQRFIESRPNSGWYVKRLAPALPGVGPEDPVQLDPGKVGMAFVIAEMERVETPYRGLSLSQCVPEPALLPGRRLAQFLGQAQGFYEPLKYAPPAGVMELRESMARQMFEAGAMVSPEDLTVTNGCKEALALALQAVCRPGDTVAVECPTYPGFLQIAGSLGLQVLEIPTSPQEGLDLEVLVWALDQFPIRAVMAVPNFQNPWGALMPDQKKLTLVELLRAREIPLIEDDVYGDLPFFGDRPRACKAFDTTGNVIYCSSFSKTLAPGYRVGWVAGGRWNEAIRQRKAVALSTCPTPTQSAVARYLREGNYRRQVLTLRRALAENTGAMAETVARTFPKGTKISRPSGGLFLWVELPEGHDADLLYRRAVPEGILICPGSVCSTTGRFRRHLRLGAGAWNGDVHRSVERLGELASLGLAP